ncbi:MAG: Mu transposase C-terminal domain-containing protein [Pseudobdellovibrionaceae bacterium]
MKMGHIVQAESHTIELSAIYLMEHDPKVLEYWDQPNPKIDLNYKNVQGRSIRTQYTPDFLVISEGFVGFEEWKPRTRLIDLAQKQSARYKFEGDHFASPPVEDALTGTGLRFRIRTDADINPVLVSNLKFLSDYLTSDAQMSELAQVKTKIQALFKNTTWMSLAHFLDNWRPLATDLVYEALVTNLIFIDIEREDLTDVSVTKVFDSEEHWRLYHANLSTPETGVKVWRHESHAIILSASPENVESATEKMKCLNRLANGEDARVVATSAGVDIRTLRRWKKAYEEMQRECDDGFLGLLSRKSARGNRVPRIPDAVSVLMEEVINEHYANYKQKNAYQVYGQLMRACESRKLVPPSIPTFYAILRQYSTQSVTERREGARVAYKMGGYESLDKGDVSMYSRARRVFEQCEVDHTQLDIELVSERSGINLGRPWLTLLFDDYSRRALGYYLTFDSPSYRSLMAVLRDTVRRYEYFPESVLVDGGKEFKCIWFEQLAARYRAIIKSREGKPRYGSHIERYFGATTTEFLYNLLGNTQPSKIGRQMTKQNDPRRAAVWTLQSLSREIDNYLDIYDKRAHPSLGCSLLEAFERNRLSAGERSGRYVPYDMAFQISTLPTTRRGVVTLHVNKPVPIRNIEYWHPSFRNPAVDGLSVPVRYDPFDLGVGYVFLQNAWLKCQAVLYESYRNRTEKELQLATEEYRQTLKKNDASKKLNLRRIAGFISQLEEKEKCLVEAKELALAGQTEPVVKSVKGMTSKITTEKKSSVEKEAPVNQGFSWGFDAPIPEDFK